MATELFESDWRYVLDTIYQLDSVEDVDDFRPKVLTCLRYAIPFCQGMFYRTVSVDGVSVVEDPPLIVGDEARYLEEFDRKYDRGMFFGGMSVMSQSGVFRDTDMIPDKMRTQTEWYQKIYAKQGIHYALRCYLAHDGALIGSIHLFRSKCDEDFTDKEMAVLGILAPHISLGLKRFGDKDASGSSSARRLERALVAQYSLTAREAEVVREIFAGESDVDIADRLCISLSTFKKHVHNAYCKLGVNSRSRLFALLQSIEAE